MKPNEFLAKVPLSRSPYGKWQVGTLSYSTGGLAILFFWLLWGDFAFQMRDRLVPPTMQLLFKNFGASDMLTGILFSSLPAGLGMVVGPIVGYQSDRLRSRWGRRIPYLAIPIPFVVISMLGLTMGPWIGGILHTILGTYSPGLNPSILIAISLFWTIFELSCLTANSVFGALINDVVPQAVIGRFMGLFRAISLIAGILVSYWLLGLAQTHFAWIFLGVAAVYGIGFTIMCLNVKEGDYPPPRAVCDGPIGPFAGVLAYFGRVSASPTISGSLPPPLWPTSPWAHSISIRSLCQKLRSEHGWLLRLPRSDLCDFACADLPTGHVGRLLSSTAALHRNDSALRFDNALRSPMGGKCLELCRRHGGPRSHCGGFLYRFCLIGTKALALV